MDTLTKTLVPSLTEALAHTGYFGIVVGYLVASQKHRTGPGKGSAQTARPA